MLGDPPARRSVLAALAPASAPIDALPLPTRRPPTPAAQRTAALTPPAVMEHESIVLDSLLFGDLGVTHWFSGLLNTVPVATEKVSFGAIKARYGQND